MVDAGGVVIWLGSAREDLVRGTVGHSLNRDALIIVSDDGLTDALLKYHN